eukprot:CAMPEP_0197004426 /NCGR_PEP_ID=MMETSP1380-20130617/22607_1 /TAXON_ID=5936 /ORGANISM="Euplotes crassus, Strain CT5" /LENGTH=207 /DNA_ID=CAMNT_0042423205 /DNA_START=9 /DNA_END=632 /DNA_ORIENTATION=-
MKLHYFNLYGRAEVIRLILHHTGTDYEDIRYEFEEWPEKKEDKKTFPFGFVPVLEKDGKSYSHSGAIIKMLGAEHGLYPTTPEGIYHVEAGTESIRDIMLELAKLKDLEPEEQKEQLGKLVPGKVTTIFSALETMLSENSSTDYWYDGKLSVADFGFACFYAGIIAKGPASPALKPALDGYPTLKKYFEDKFEEFKDYFDQRPECPF